MSQAIRNHRANLATIAALAMFSRGLEPEFPLAVHQQLNRLTGPARDDGAQVRQLTGLLWCSIDNDDSRDLDQLTVCEVDATGRLRLLVAIADVDALVKKDSPVDAHAHHNTTSVYTSARSFPMLPELLCTDLTSLAPHADRLAVVVQMDFSAAGVLADATIYRALVRNQAQLAYDAVSAWLQGEAPMPPAVQAVAGLDAQLRLQDQLAQLLRSLRLASGALQFETFQPRAVFEGNRIADIRLQEHNRARQLIEEFMIATNGCTARFLMAHGATSLRRVVRSPERWQRIVELAHGYGAKLPAQPDAAKLEHFLARQHRLAPASFPDLSLEIIKLMGSGEYVVERQGEPAIGHFGLAVQDYMHSTAPNRRYPDLVTQRLLKAVLAGSPPPYTLSELGELALHCTGQEDAARKVERQMRKSEAALLLHDSVGKVFRAIVSGVNTQGIWVRIFAPPAEGRLVGELPDARLGQLLQVRLLSTSVERGFIDFARDRAH
ncbi:RNB domain-containing ribonuclease [Pseudoduganella sp. OTU4001]|uniref:RNB domain-containing ribonuclease n=1 Tax=Pseudoduganella sp. OTU4001 TaxID=3043854 RepID=UPI00313AA635